MKFSRRGARISRRTFIGYFWIIKCFIKISCVIRSGALRSWITPWEFKCGNKSRKIKRKRIPKVGHSTFSCGIGIKKYKKKSKWRSQNWKYFCHMWSCFFAARDFWTRYFYLARACESPRALNHRLNSVVPPRDGIFMKNWWQQRFWRLFACVPLCVAIYQEGKRMKKCCNNGPPHCVTWFAESSTLFSPLWHIFCVERVDDKNAALGVDGRLEKRNELNRAECDWVVNSALNIHVE